MSKDTNIRLVKNINDLSGKKYDLLVALGYGFVDEWQLSEHVKVRLKLISGLFQQGVAKKVAVCGKWAMKWDKENIIPPTTEAEEMKKFLVNLGVPDGAIIVEDSSKDSIGNAYFLRLLIENTGIRSLLVVCADYVLERVLYCWGKVYDEEYKVDILPTESPYALDDEAGQAQLSVLRMEKEFLGLMKKGDIFFLEDLYNNPHYKRERPGVADQVGKGGLK